MFSTYFGGVLPFVEVDESESLWLVRDLVLGQVDSRDTTERPEQFLPNFAEIKKNVR